MSSSRRRYTASHWGVYEVDASGLKPKLKPAETDPDPSPIGLDQLDEAVTRLRVRRPSIRKSWLDNGPGSSPERRGREPFVEVEWHEALDLAVAELKRVKDQHGNQAIFGGSYGWSSAGRFHHAQSQVHRFLNSMGGYVRSVDTYSLGAGMVIMPHVVAPAMELNASHTSWDVLAQHTKLFVAFGGVPLKNTQITSGGAGDHRVRGGLDAMTRAGVRFVNISPVRDSLETASDTPWLPIRPNTDVALMLGLAHTLRVENLHDTAFLAGWCVGFDRFQAYLLGETDGTPKTAEWAASITGIEAATVRQLARDMAATRTLVNVTWSLQRAAHGEQPFWGVVMLAAMLGQIGLPGGGFGIGYGGMNSIGSDHRRFSGPLLPQGSNPVRDFIPVARIADMLLNPGTPFTYNGATHRYPDIRLIYWAGGNPFHHHQDLNRLRKAWARPDTILVNEQFWTATARHADIVFPASTTLERNDIGSATREGYLVAMKTVVEPLAESRSDFDIFSDLAAGLGTHDAFTEGRSEADWLRYLYDGSKTSATRAGIDLPDFETFWAQNIVSLAPYTAPYVMLQDFRNDPVRHPLPTPSKKIELFSERIAGFDLADCPGHPAWMEPFEWLGSAEARLYPLHLLSDQPSRRLHSQLDHSPHSLAGKIDGREPIWLHPDDALARGIKQHDVVEVFNARGALLAAAVLSENIRPGVARLATGTWYSPDAEGVDRFGNPNVLTLDRGASSLSQGCAAQTCLVDIRRFAGPVDEGAPHELPILVHRTD